MPKSKLVFITTSENKLEELTCILGQNFPYELVSQHIELLECQGDEDFIVKNKSREAFKLTKGPVIVEDTSLAFNAFDGLPGPYIKYFLEKMGPQGLYRMLKDWEDKSAVLSCRIAFCSSLDSEPIVFLGEIKGQIVEARGRSGFGFDYCFQPVGQNKTYAEMEQREKNCISHRFLAANAMREYFTSLENRKNTRDINALK